MRLMSLTLASLSLAAGVAAAQDDRKGDKAKTVESCEVRVYLREKDRKDVDLKGITASLVIEEKDGKPARTIPMTLTQPRAAEKIRSTSSGQAVAVEGTEYTADLVVVRTTPPGVAEEGAKTRPLDAVEEERKSGVHASSYFKAEMNRDQDPVSKDCTVAVHFVIKGQKHVATGFKCSTEAAPQGKADDSGNQQQCPEFRALEQALTANDMDKAKTAVARLCDTLAASDKDKHKKECMDTCVSLKTAIEAGDREKALKILEKCKSKSEGRTKVNN